MGTVSNIRRQSFHLKKPAMLSTPIIQTNRVLGIISFNWLMVSAL
jgi:hypothetical protein